ncbi:hypothetical protein [Planotetraspora silvatica]|uniref:hypothetical protein n=1 Tax=Planotetraspora silvatica TaxID=234614 RepID=UPI0019503BA6|nr:hypothetical protein [Planotetraspora silvatica]
MSPRIFPPRRRAAGARTSPVKPGARDARDLAVLTVSDATLAWSLSVATVSTRRPNAAVRAPLDLVDHHVRDTAASGS